MLLICAVLAVALIMAIQRGRMGRLLRGLSDSPTALETHGATTNVIRVLIFCISAALAAFAGALTASFFRFSVGSNYASFQSLILVAIIVISVGGAPWYGIIAALGFVAVPGYVTVSNINTYLEILFGVGAATFAITSQKPPIVPLRLRNFLDRIGGRATEPRDPKREALLAVEAAIPAERQAAEAVVQGPIAAAPTRGGLTVEHLAVHFGGVHAVEDLSLAAPLGRITGLIGPNGAGKTTTFNACSGLVRPTQGDVFFHDAKVTAAAPYLRARMGIGRTFQKAELFNSLSVRDNIQLGREASLAGANPLTQLFGSRSSR